MFRVVAISFCLIGASAAAGFGLSLRHDWVSRQAVVSAETYRSEDRRTTGNAALIPVSLQTEAPVLGDTPDLRQADIVQLDQTQPARATVGALSAQADQTAQSIDLPVIVDPHGTAPEDSFRDSADVQPIPITILAPAHAAVTDSPASARPLPDRAQPVMRPVLPRQRMPAQTMPAQTMPSRAQTAVPPYHQPDTAPVPRYMIGVYR